MDGSSRGKISMETLDLNYRSNRHVQNIPSSSSGIHILLSCTPNILQKRSSNRSPKEKFLENLRILKSYWVSFQPQWHKTGNWYQEVNSKICGDKTKHSQSCRLKKKSKWQLKKKDLEMNKSGKTEYWNL